MRTRRWMRWGTVGVVAALALVGTGVAEAAASTAIDKGGAFCLRIGTVMPGATSSVLTLDIDRADHPTKQPLWWVSGVEKGSNPDVALENYVNLLAGTATLDRPNNGKAGAALIHMSLSGTSFGSYKDPQTTGIWVLNYVLQLNPKTLKGTITGLEVFTPISGQSAGAATTLAVNQSITRISCKTI